MMHPYPPSPASSTLSAGEDDDAILPVYEAGRRACCPLSSSLPSSLPSPLPSPMPSPSPSSSSLDTARLWHHMLALQRRYHCYNSARVSAALEDSSVAATVPSRACLDLLNDSIDLQMLPEAVRNDVAALFQQGGLEDAGCLAESRLSWLLAEDEDAEEEADDDDDDDDDDVVPLDLGLPLLPWVPAAAVAVAPLFVAEPTDAKESIALAELEELEELEQVEEQTEREAQSTLEESTERTEQSDTTDAACSAAPLRKLGLRFGLRLGLRLPTWRRQRHTWRLSLQV